ncbi:hypothetical protein FB473_000012 [Brooklawnia cerclae]|uniref:Uncharacterized protein n=1 Tax=Brooklawnia cerclae TaxID=349934 RepID=A0ABX0SAC3_9ACTN|nr:hypothetical protein [Brooklawnia cerclae]
MSDDSAASEESDDGRTSQAPTPHTTTATLAISEDRRR